MSLSGWRKFSIQRLEMREKASSLWRVEGSFGSGGGRRKGVVEKWRGGCKGGKGGCEWNGNGFVWVR